MDQSRISEIFEILMAACQEQFGFEPNRISEKMHYMGPDGHGKHRFRDSISHATIILQINPRKATLLESHSGHVYWTPDQIAEYKKSDEDADAEDSEYQRKNQVAANSALWQKNRLYLRSLYLDDPSYDKKLAETPFEGAVKVVTQAAERNDPDFLQYSKDMGLTDPETLGDWLLEGYDVENEKSMWEHVREDKAFPDLIRAMKALQADPKSEKLKAQAEETALDLISRIPSYLQINSRHVLVMVLMDHAKLP